MQFSILVSSVLALAATTSAIPAPQSAEVQCWETCSIDCENAGNIRGGLCDAAGTCTCLTGQKRDALPEPEPQSAVIDCWSTCSYDCVQAGQLRGGLCDASGTCTCLSGTKRDALPEPAPAPQLAVIDWWSTCSYDCVQAGQLRGGLCDASGTCTCLTGTKRDVEVQKREGVLVEKRQLECYETCSTDCINGGDIKGGMCDASGTCTCL